MSEKKKGNPKMMWIWVVALILWVLVLKIPAKDKEDKPVDKTNISQPMQYDNKESEDLLVKIDNVINNEVGKKYEREITLMDDVINGGKIVSISIDMKGKGRINLLSNAADIFKNLFESNEVSEAQIWYSADLVDTKGKTENISVMKIILKRETANDIGWDLFNVKDFSEVADDYWEHDVYKK